MPTRSGSKDVPARPNSTRTVLELAEEAVDRFDEACEHAQRAPGHSGLVLGPSLSVPMVRLRAGCLAWGREVRDGAGRAELYYVLDPGPSERDRSSGDLPLQDLERARILTDSRASEGSPVRVLGVGDPKTAPGAFASFVRAVLAELASETE